MCGSEREVGCGCSAQRVCLCVCANIQMLAVVAFAVVKAPAMVAFSCLNGLNWIQRVLEWNSEPVFINLNFFLSYSVLCF